MAATRAQIASWFNQGVALKMAYMIVWCDDFDYEDYPQFVKSHAGALKAIDHPSPMQRVMEVYDLGEDKEEQLDTFRCWAVVPTNAMVAVLDELEIFAADADEIWEELDNG